MLIAVIIILSTCTSKKANVRVISYSSLLNDMIDREKLARFPDPGYVLLQTSSWDRSQTSPQDTSTWFANADYNHWIREERVDNRTEYVIMDAHGPGAITRWWIPQEQSLKHRTLRIYLDGNPEPVIAENYQDFMNGSSYVPWPFAFTSSDEKDVLHQYSLPVGHPKQVGASFYLPIPFAKSCKVTLDDKPFYYVLNYRMYEEGTKVTSFSREDFEKNKALLKSTGNILLADNLPEEKISNKTSGIAPGESLELNLPNGENAIRSIQLRTNSQENKQKNRRAVIQIIFDGHQTVWSPLSEFFGGGVYARPVKNYNIEVSKDGSMAAYWTMPYQKSAKVVLKNYGSEKMEAQLDVAVEKYEWDKTSMYFHAKWHEEAPLNTPPIKDWNYIQIKGKGVYVGDVLTVYSENPIWWGEGDEKIYIDGENFPSHLGTGLEDYYGYAWGMANFFSSPLISMPNRDARGKGDWRGYTTVARQRLLDGIPFRTDLKVDVEAWQTVGGTSYSVTSFWYALPGASDNLSPDEEAIVRTLPDFEEFHYIKSPGEKFPDPAKKGLTKPHGNGSIRQAGNHLDLLNWRVKKVRKPLDMDGNNEYGSAGYHLPGVRQFDHRELTFKTDSLQRLPGFVAAISYLETSHSLQDAWFYLASEDQVSYITGLIEVPGKRAEKELLTFIVNKDVPSIFRLGIMLDNADSFEKVGEYLKVTNSGGGNSGDIPLAKSNRFPDWYFFDLLGLKAGNKVTITGKTKNSNDIFTLGAITFDVKNEEEK